jgi:hypothetical protein
MEIIEQIQNIERKQLSLVLIEAQMFANNICILNFCFCSDYLHACITEILCCCKLPAHITISLTSPLSTPPLCLFEQQMYYMMIHLTITRPQHAKESNNNHSCKTWTKIEQRAVFCCL